MAQAGIALAKIPLASPQPTAPPHPRDLARQVYQRQLTPETCGWVDGDLNDPQYCDLGSICAYNTALYAAFCCDITSFPTSCFYVTTCFDSAAVPNLCDEACQDDPANKICTAAGSEYCLTKEFSYSAVDVYLTEWDCTSASSMILFVNDEASIGAAASSTIYASATGAAASGPLVSAVVSSSTLGPSSSGSISTSALLGPTTTSTTPLGPVTATPTAVPAPIHKSGLSGGAIAGIVVGIVLLLVVALGMFLLYRYFKGRKSPPPPPPSQLNHDTTPQPISMATVQQGSPTLSNRPSNFTMPSNAPLYSPPMNELSPDETKVGSYPTSHSAVGTLPQFSVQHGGQPPASPRTEFGSMTPVHAPDVSSEYTFVPKGPQQ